MGAVGPDAQLFAGGGTEGVGGGQQHAGALVAEVAGEFANGGGFAGAVDAGDHDDRGAVLSDHQGGLQGVQQLGNGIGQQGFDGLGFLGAGLFDAALQVGQQVLGGLHTRVGHQQGGFEFFIELVVDAGAREDLGDLAAGAFETGAQTTQPTHTLGIGGRLRCLGRGCRGGRRGCGRRAGRGRYRGRGWVFFLEEAEHAVVGS